MRRIQLSWLLIAVTAGCPLAPPSIDDFDPACDTDDDCAAALSRCGPDGRCTSVEPPDGGVLRDGGTPVDAGAATDAGSPSDAGGDADAGAPSDAGADADAGAPSDAGADADAGAPIDAGADTDAGAVVDAGAPLDAGADVDAGAPPVDAGVPGDWFDTVYRGRQRVLFDRNTPSADVTDAPIAVHLPASWEGHAGAGYAFVDAAGDGTLPHDEEVFDGADRSTLWVRAPLVAADGSSFVWLYFDPRAGAGAAQDRPGTWSGYEGAWHFTGDFLDASGNGQHAADFGTSDVAGVTGRARHFGGDEYLQLGGTFGSLASFSASLWFRISQHSDHQMLWHIGENGTTGDGYGQTAEFHMHMQNDSLVPEAFLEGGAADIYVGGPGAVDEEMWHHQMVTWDGSTARVYVDGQAGGSTTGTPSDFAFDLHHLGRPGYNDRTVNDGELDEPRFTNAVRSLESAQLEYESVRGRLITLGPIERIP